MSPTLPQAPHEPLGGNSGHSHIALPLLTRAFKETAMSVAARLAIIVAESLWAYLPPCIYVTSAIQGD
ncbi:hypothetical protein Ple7327_2748 [Pleurocapsa sp. PCC 7327]|nr:hypothetical protein Ple7327_2748 [Pleurocapsa sp. PCC 7327]